MQAAGLIEDLLMLRELSGQRTENARRDRLTAGNRRAAHLYLLECSLPADPARRVREIAPLAHVVGNADAQAHGHDVEHLLVFGADAVRDAVEIVGPVDEPFG